MNFFEPIEQKAPWLEESTVLLAYSGSRAYGTDVDDSDTDVRGVFIPPYDMLVNPFQPPEQYGYHSETADFLIFDIRKFLRLATKGNPNVIELLWIEPEHWLIKDPTWKALFLSRQMFLTQDLANAFIGYAMNELKSLRNSMDVMKAPRPGRKTLVDLYGFDTKSAMHALRISRMCYEICTHGVVQVHRKDAEELIGVRKGKRPLRQILEEVQETLVKSRDTLITNLPEKVNPIEVSFLCEQIVSEFLTRD